jgi:hypothetical protein
MFAQTTAAAARAFNMSSKLQPTPQDAGSMSPSVPATLNWSHIESGKTAGPAAFPCIALGRNGHSERFCTSLCELKTRILCKATLTQF